MTMKKILSSFFIALIFICSAQTAETIYLQKEHDRLARVNNHEVAIQIYIDQNIASYTLSSVVVNKVSTQTHEDGSNFTQTELNEALLSAKKQELRVQYFNQNPSIVNDYKASVLTAGTSCVNNGFENGDTSSFSFFSQRFLPWNMYNNFPTAPVIAQVGGIVSLVESGYDSVVPTLSKVKSGNYALRLNNSSDGNYDISMLKREIIVGANQDNITFNYALVLEDPGHVDNNGNIVANPYYQCRLKTASGSIIFERKIVADRYNTLIFKTANNGGIVYTDWVCESIDVSQYKGQNVVLEVIIGDCGLGGHWGYVYLDDFCGARCSAPTFGKVTLEPMGITCPLLPLTVSGNLITPAGYMLDKLILQAKDFLTPSVVYEDSSGLYTLFGNEFSFNVTGQNLFPSGPTNKQIDFFVSASFKLIGSNPATYFPVESQSANEGADVIFNASCVVCNACTPFVSYPKNIYKGNATCIGGRLRLMQPTPILLYGAVPGNDLSDGEILYTNINLTIPYTGTESQSYLRDGSGNIFYVSPYDGTLVLRDSNCEDL